MDAFLRIASVVQLRAGWERVARNRGGPGGDEVTLGMFEIGLEERLHRLSRDLLAGDYWPRPVRLVEIPKRGGGTRILSIPSVADRVVQSSAALVLGPVLDAEFSDASFGYRPGRSVQQAVRRVAYLRRQGYHWIVDADIDDYFDNIRHDRLLERLERSVSDERVVDLVSRWLEAYAEHGVGLPQGSPISPLLANLYLDDVDDRIAKRDVHLVRFGDDFLILTKRQVAAERALEEVKEALAEQGLRLNAEGTRIADFDDSLRFLGHLFVRSMAMKEVELDGGGLRLPPPNVIGEAIDKGGQTPPWDAPADGLPGEAKGDRAPGLRVLYLMERGRKLVRVNESFGVVEDEELIFAVQPGRVDRIELGPGVEPDPNAIRHALTEGVPLAFVDGHGTTLGTLEPRPAERAKLHLEQARVILDEAARLALARRLVAGRLFNQRSLLRRLNRRRKRPEVAKAAHDIGRLIRLLDRQPDQAGLMGVEGRAGALYWPALGQCLEPGWKLTHRRRRPPPDPVNLVISYLATMLTRDIAALAMRRGLHTGFGVLHATQDARHALALDLVEEFRAPLVEGLAVYLCNNRILKPEMFEAKDGAVRLWSNGTKAIIRGYEAWLDRAVQSPRSGEKIGWRRLIDEQIVAYGQHMLGGEAYAPYALDH